MQQLIVYMEKFIYFQHNARLYLLSNALSGMTSGITLVLYPLYLSALGHGTDFIGLLFFVATLGIGLAVFPAGLCVDRFSSRAILIWSSVLIGIGSAGEMLFRHPVLLCVSVFVTGLGIAFVFVLNAPFLTRNSVPAERAHLFSINIVIALVTIVLGEVFGGALPLWLRQHPWAMFPHLSWLLASEPLARSYQITLLSAGLLALPSFIPLFLMTDDRPIQVRSEQQQSGFPMGQAADRRKVRGQAPDLHLRFLREILLKCQHNFRKGGTAVLRRDATGLVFWRGVRTFLLSPLAVMMGVNVLLGFGAGMLLPYFSLFFVEHLGATSAHFGIIDGTANTLNAVVTLFGPWMAMRIGRVATILLPRLLAIPILLCIGLFPLLALAAILYPLRQGLTGIPSSIWQVFSMEVVPAEHQGLANSCYQSANKIAWAASAPLGGILISRLGYTPVFLIVAVFYLLSIALFWWRFGGKRFIF
jgi:MFS family permease